MKLLHTFGDQTPAAAAAIARLEQRGAVNTMSVAHVVADILREVRTEGDPALTRYAEQFDHLDPGTPLRVTRDEMREAWEHTSPELQNALRTARENIRRFAERQMPGNWSLSPAKGVETGQIIRPLASVGCYVPGGRYPLPSTLLMTVTPAQVAGVPRIVVCSPRPARETLAAAWLAGVTEFYRIGGAQAIAALAFGTATIAQVDKIVGPGNLYVTAAKIAVSGLCGIDMPAGPTEIVVTSETGGPAAIAADLVAQAEHDPEALAILITTDMALATAVDREVALQSAGNPIARQALEAQGHIFVTETVTEARALTNRLAPEHLTIDEASDLRWVENAGSVFIGPHTPQSLGDYVSGPNHVLPTGRHGRIRGGLSVQDFVKIITVQRYSPAGLHELGPHAAALADAEGLQAHAASVRSRMETP